MKAGVDEAKLNALSSYRESARFTAREKAALEFAELITRDDCEVTESCAARLREHFSEAEIVELVFIIGFQTFASKFAKAFQIAPQGYSSRVAATNRV